MTGLIFLHAIWIYCDPVNTFIYQYPSAYCHDMIFTIAQYLGHHASPYLCGPPSSHGALVLLLWVSGLFSFFIFLKLNKSTDMYIYIYIYT